MGRGVDLPQGIDTPGVAEGLRGDEAPGAPTAAQDRPGEEERGRGGGDKNPPTAQATRMQGADSGAGKLMGGQWMAEPPNMTEAAEEDGSAGPRPRQSDGADSARSKHVMLDCREYDLLASEATEAIPAQRSNGGKIEARGTP